jgi:hypothetical protein
MKWKKQGSRWDLVGEDGEVLGWVLRYEGRQGWRVRVEGVPWAKKYPDRDGRRVNYPGTARSKADAEKVILEARRLHFPAARS